MSGRRFFTVFDLENGFAADDYAAVAHLPATFGVEGGGIQNDGGFHPFGQGIYGLAVLVQKGEDFALAAGRAKEAGFDGVEIHSAHGYLLNQFYSPITNQRTDQYGGSLVNRIRLHIQIIERIRQTVGGDYPLTLRLGVYDGLENGSTMDEAVQACVMFEKAGLDFIDLSGGLNGYLRPGHSEQGYFQDFSEAVKQQVKMPVLLTGGITEAQAAEALLQAQKADLIGIGRAILKDSKWAEKALNTIK